MMFKKGQPVWIGWTPNRLCTANKQHCRLRVGTIVGGPFDGLHVRSPAWSVDVDGEQCLAHESLLTPFHDPDPETETAEQGEIAA